MLSGLRGRATTFPFESLHIYGLPGLESDDPRRLATQDAMDVYRYYVEVTFNSPEVGF